MIWRLEIKLKDSVFDALAGGIQRDISDLGLKGISKVEVRQIYHLYGSLNKSEVEKIGRELLSDLVTQTFSFSDQFHPSKKNRSKTVHEIEIAYNSGVMDPVEESTLKGIRDLGINSVGSVSTAKKYILHGSLSTKNRQTIVEKILSNKLIQHEVSTPVVEQVKSLPSHADQFELKLIDILGASDRKLKKISDQGQLFLNVNEMKVIKKHFKKVQRNPTDCELETIAQTWSEHCYHKTFRGKILYHTIENGKKKTKQINNLLKSTIVKATTEINKSWCVSVFHDNAGVIKFDDETNVCFKVETHNHPSALEPYGGANTGIGGVIRDILGTGLGAKPVCNTDVFCFAPPEMSFKQLPDGTLHPKRVMKGVVSGVRDYGNKMGIPTVNGAVLFDERFVGNPLVYCGNVGIMPKDKVKKKVCKGDLIVVFGGKTGRDGIHGATFSSGELTTESEVISSGAVQIGDPIQEKKVLDVLLKARDQNLYTSITDCGAGGLSSAVGEMGQELGAEVHLERVPLKYKGLKYTEIWISESQERMVISVPPENIEQLMNTFSAENVEGTVIGEFTGRKRLELYFSGCQVCDLDMGFLHEGTPRITKEARWSSPKTTQLRLPKKINFNKALLDVLSHHNVCSKEWIIRQYDHEVQGGSVIKPLVGVADDGPSDASVVAPKFGSKKCLAISNGINVRYGMIDPFWMAASCIDEAIRQVIAVGGNVDKIAILDNFCWGNPDKPDRLGGLVRCAQGCYETAIGFKVPFISGKDSLYNEYAQGNKSIAIPGTILISAIGIINDLSKTVTMDFKQAGNLVYCVGETFDECGGSIYLDTLKNLGHNVPQVNTKKATKIYQSLSKAVGKELIRSMHDCSEGGLAVALAEMAFSGGLGLTARLDQVSYKGKKQRDDIVLFSESNSRLVVEVDPSDQKRFEQETQVCSISLIGKVEETPEFVIYGLDKKVCINIYIQDLKEAWQKTLRW